MIDVIITTGGTGFTGRDVTPEAVEPLFDKKMDGFSALFLVVSFPKIGTSAIQSRATAGVASSTYIFCLPGSPGACKDAWDEILVHQLDYRYGPCNFVEIMPRLDEHLRRPKARARRFRPVIARRGPVIASELEARFIRQPSSGRTSAARARNDIYNSKSQCSLTTGGPQLLCRSLRISLKPAFS